MAEVRFLLNGAPRREHGLPPTTTVLDYLRTTARLTGTKEGCAEGDCGACTIVIARPPEVTDDVVARHLDYEAVNSCLMMLPQLDGCAVFTVEGLADQDGTLDPVQQALIDTDATQCGFCTPGFAMAMLAFRQSGEPASLIHEALAGNLCRCTGYRSIVDACRRIAGTPAGRLADGAAVLGELVPATEYRHGSQRYLAPRSLDELVGLRARHPDAILLAGGTDLGLRVSKDHEALPLLISTGHVVELRQIGGTADALEIGGAVTYTQALPALDRHFPAFGALVRRIGSRQIRNLGTIAGNLATASPIGDTLPCLIALDAAVTLVSPSGKRVLPVESFITGYRETALAHDEVIAAIRIPLLRRDVTFAAYKLSKRFDQDISTVVAGFRLAVDGGRVDELRAAFGGMAARVMRAANLEAALTGRPWTADGLADVDELIRRDFAPISDQRGSARYRLRAAAGLSRRLALETTTDLPARLEAL